MYWTLDNLFGQVNADMLDGKQARAEALIDLAAPEFRNELRAQWKNL